MTGNDRVQRMIELAGVGSRSHGALRASLSRQLERERTEDDKDFLFESWIAQALPCDVEDPGLDVEDPWPETTPELLACHFSGLFVNDLVATMLGAALGDRTFVLDTNGADASGDLPVYVAETKRLRSGERLLVGLVPYVYLPSIASVSAAREAFAPIAVLSTEEPTPELAQRRDELGRAFVSEYPGIARLEREYLASALGEEVVASAPAPEALPAALSSVHAAFLALAPSFLEAKGLPKPGSAKDAAAKAAASLATSADAGAHAAPRLLAELFVAWLSGDEAAARTKAEAILAGSDGAPLARRWASRLLGREPEE